MLAQERGFPRHARLLKASQFRRVFQQARRASDSDFTLLARTNGGEPARLGLAISKKQLRRAVDRNRIKRLVRESFRHRRDALHGLDIVVMARGRVARRSNSQLRDALNALWQTLLDEAPA